MMYRTFFFSFEATDFMFKSKFKSFYNILFKYFPMNKVTSYYYKRFYQIVMILIVLSFVFKIQTWVT